MNEKWGEGKKEKKRKTIWYVEKQKEYDWNQLSPK